MAEVFAALQDGTFLEKLSNFNDEQIRPFLPSLFISTFMSVDNLETCNVSWIPKLLDLQMVSNKWIVCDILSKVGDTELCVTLHSWS